MFLVVVMHTCKPDMVEAAIRRIDRNGEMMSEVPGFLFRHRTQATHSERVIGTVTGWDDEPAYERWIEIKRRLPDEGPSPYEHAKSERHRVIRSHAPAYSGGA